MQRISIITDPTLLRQHTYTYQKVECYRDEDGVTHVCTPGQKQITYTPASTTTTSAVQGQENTSTAKTITINLPDDEKASIKSALDLLIAERKEVQQSDNLDDNDYRTIWEALVSAIPYEYRDEIQRAGIKISSDVMSRSYWTDLAKPQIDVLLAALTTPPLSTDEQIKLLEENLNPDAKKLFGPLLHVKSYGATNTWSPLAVGTTHGSEVRTILGGMNAKRIDISREGILLLARLMNAESDLVKELRTCNDDEEMLEYQSNKELQKTLERLYTYMSFNRSDIPFIRCSRSTHGPLSLNHVVRRNIEREMHQCGAVFVAGPWDLHAAISNYKGESVGRFAKEDAKFGDRDWIQHEGIYTFAHLHDGRVYIDGVAQGEIVDDPWRDNIGIVQKGKHPLIITAFDINKLTIIETDSIDSMEVTYPVHKKYDPKTFVLHVNYRARCSTKDDQIEACKSLIHNHDIIDLAKKVGAKFVTVSDKREDLNNDNALSMGSKVGDYSVSAMYIGTKSS